MVVILGSIGAAGRPDGAYHFEGLDVTIAQGSARLEDGTLAGSVSTLEKEIVKLVRMTDVPLVDALRFASLNPAAEIGISSRKGQLAPGNDADLICLDKDTLALQWSMVRGHRFDRE